MPVEVIVKSLFILIVVVVGLAPVITWIERKQSAVMQDRIGANRADVAGITVLGLPGWPARWDVRSVARDLAAAHPALAERA